MRLLHLLVTMGVFTLASVGCDSSVDKPGPSGGGGGNASAGGAGGATGAGGNAGAGGDAAWTECPPYQYDDYDGQACVGTLHCTYYTADCPDLSGLGWECDCVEGAFTCSYKSCD
jgi:hypothetical protein